MLLFEYTLTKPTSIANNISDAFYRYDSDMFLKYIKSKGFDSFIVSLDAMTIQLKCDTARITGAYFEKLVKAFTPISILISKTACEFGSGFSDVSQSVFDTTFESCDLQFRGREISIQWSTINITHCYIHDITSIITRNSGVINFTDCRFLKTKKNEVCTVSLATPTTTLRPDKDASIKLDRCDLSPLNIVFDSSVDYGITVTNCKLQTFGHNKDTPKIVFNSGKRTLLDNCDLPQLYAYPQTTNLSGHANNARILYKDTITSSFNRGKISINTGYYEWNNIKSENIFISSDGDFILCENNGGERFEISNVTVTMGYSSSDTHNQPFSSVFFINSKVNLDYTISHSICYPGCDLYLGTIGELLIDAPAGNVIIRTDLTFVELLNNHRISYSTPSKNSVAVKPISRPTVFSDTYGYLITMTLTPVFIHTDDSVEQEISKSIKLADEVASESNESFDVLGDRILKYFEFVSLVNNLT